MLQIQWNDEFFTINEFISVGREINLHPYQASGAFQLPSFETATFTVDGFKGSIDDGPCRVDVHSYSPHNHTHVETSAHVVNNGLMINQVERDNLHGVLYLLDLSDRDIKLITSDLLENLPKNIDKLAIKTSSSKLPQNYDFSGKNFTALDPDCAKLIRELGIQTLITDLPSADEENDGGKLFAHRNYFNLPLEGKTTDIVENKILVELAHFGELTEGWYYFIATLPSVQVDATLINPWLSKLEK